MLSFPVSFLQFVAVGFAFGVGRSIGPLLAMLGEERHWSSDLGRVSRLVERLGSVLTATVAVTAAWLTIN